MSIRSEEKKTSLFNRFGFWLMNLPILISFIGLIIVTYGVAVTSDLKLLYGALAFFFMGGFLAHITQLAYARDEIRVPFMWEAVVYLFAIMFIPASLFVSAHEFLKGDLHAAVLILIISGGLVAVHYFVYPRHLKVR
jgi:hypothetical protein